MSETHKEPQTLLMFLATFWLTDRMVEAVHAQPRFDFFQIDFLEKVKIAQRAVFLAMAQMRALSSVEKYSK